MGGRIVLASHDAGGTIPPMQALAEVFVSRGHEVTWLAQPSVAARARRAGCEYVAFDGLDDYAPRVAIEEQLDLAGALLVSPDVGRQLASVATDRGAALLVVDANLATAATAAEAFDAPSAVLLHSMYATFTDIWVADIWPLVEPFVNDARAQFGVPPADGWAAVFAGHDRVLSVVPERFDAPAHPPLDGMRHFGFLVPTTHGEASVTWPDHHSDRPRVIVSLGTTYLGQEQRTQDVLDALGALDVDALATTSGQVEAGSLRCPPNVAVHTFVDHASLLPHCDLMITHAGLGSVAVALAHGVPLVCLPFARDQHLNAERVRTIGAGLCADDDPGSIEEVVRTVLHDSAFRNAAARIRDESEAAGGPHAAVADLETLLF